MNAPFCGIQQLASPVGICQPVKRAHKLFPIARQYARRMRRCLQIAEGFQHNILQALVIAPRAENVDQCGKAVLFARILRFEYILQHICLHRRLFTLIRRAEIRRQAQFVEMLAQQAHAERMHCRDFRAVYQHQLAPQADVARMLCGKCSQCVGNFAAHLARRGFGKCDNEK